MSLNQILIEQNINFRMYKIVLDIIQEDNMIMLDDLGFINDQSDLTNGFETL